MPLHLGKALSALNLHSGAQSEIQPDHFPPRLYPSRRSRDCEVAMTSHAGREVIFISDDEDFARPRAGNRRPRPNSTSSTSSVGDGHADFLKSTHQPQRRRLPQHSSKRLKAEDDEDDALSLVDSPTNPSTESTKIKLSFPGRHRNDSRASFSFENHQPLQNTTNSHYDPYGRLQRANSDATVPPIMTTISSRKSMNKCPYYTDTKLEVKMYCGRGYDRFPVVLGTVKGHKAICDKWDAEQNEERKLQEAQAQGMLTSEDPILSSVNSFTLASNSSSTTGERQCFREVLTIFPQIERKFVNDKYQALHARLAAATGQDVQEQPSSAEIIAEIADLETYPKELGPEISEAIAPLPEDETGITITWNKDIPKTDMYSKEAIILLAAEFTHIPTHAISKIVKLKNSLFDTYIYFTEIETTYYDNNGLRPYARSKTARVVLEKKYSRGHSEPRDGHLYVNLVNELQAARQQVAREEARANKKRATEEAEATNLAIYKAGGALVECQCCFDDEIAMNRAVMCEGDVGHFFCFGCVLGLAESQVGAMKHEMRCMDSSGCKSILSIEGVGEAITTKLFDKLAFYEQQAEISAAGIDDLEQCPQCEFKAICDPIEVNSVFTCQNIDCGKVTCRKCHENSHLPKTCEEAKGDKGLSARHLVEEARSQAMIRQCPKCKAKIIKELGCNKLMCSCGCMMCYVCKANISGGKDSGYQHFHQAGAKCPLHDAQGTEQHDEDANAAEKEAIKKVKANEQYQDVDEKLLQVETGADKGKKKKTKAAQLRFPVAFPMLGAGRPDLERQIAALERQRQALQWRQQQVQGLVEAQAPVQRQQMQGVQQVRQVQERRALASPRTIALLQNAQMEEAGRDMVVPGLQAGLRHANLDIYAPPDFALGGEQNGFGAFMPAFGQGYPAFMPNMHMHMPQHLDFGLADLPAMPNMPDMPAMPDFMFGDIPAPHMPPLPANGGGQMERERWFQDMQEHFQRQ